MIAFSLHEVSLDEKNLVELDFYAVNEPFAYVKILKDNASLDKYYKVIEPVLSSVELTTLNFIQESLMNSMDIMLNELKPSKVEEFLVERIDRIIKDYEMNVDEVLKTKILYYVKRDFLRFGKIDSLMHDPNIEDISCDGSSLPLFLYHRKYGSLKSSIQFNAEPELSAFVIKLAQKCGKHISIAEPMLDATMPDGSRIQMTLSKAVTTKGSTFTIRKFRSDPITATDLILYKTMSAEMVAYLWLAVENGVNALIAGGTASGKTSTLNAISLFIPREAKIVSIEETREINLPHPNWIPGVVRSGFGEVINDRMAGEIDLYDLMKAALRQRPEYILVGEIRGKEAYVLFQAMATGHTTYSTVHADSPSSLIHRLEGKPIEIPRVMLQSLDIVTIQVQAQVGDQRVRRCKQIVEIVDIDPVTKEILTNEVFRWDPVEDHFYYSGKSYVLERIRSQYEMDKDGMMEELRRRVEVLEWMKSNNIRAFKDVARVVASYTETPDELMEKVRRGPQIPQEPEKPMIPTDEVTIVEQGALRSGGRAVGSEQTKEKPPEVSMKTKKKFGFKRRNVNGAHKVSAN
jgi:flagellar protein FlaI